VLVRGGRGEDGEGDRDPATSSSGLKRKRMLGAILDEHAPTSPAQAQPEAPEATSPADASSACTNSELAEIFASPVPPHPTAAPVVETQAEAEAEASGVSEDVGARWSLVFGSPLRGAEAEAEAETAAEAEATSETQLLQTCLLHLSRFTCLARRRVPLCTDVRLPNGQLCRLLLTP
jgi:hypothetical protein